MGMNIATLYLLKDTSAPNAVVRMFSFEPTPLVVNRRKTVVTVPSGAPLSTLLAQLNTLLTELSGIAGEETYVEVTMEQIDPTLLPPG